jgi:hypothetical protein
MSSSPTTNDLATTTTTTKPQPPQPSWITLHCQSVKQYWKKCKTLSPTIDGFEWHRAQNQLMSSLRQLDKTNNPTKAQRLEMYDSGVYEIVIDIILATPQLFTTIVIDAAWTLFGAGLLCPEIDEKDNYETVSKGVELNVIEIAVRELNFSPPRSEGNNTLYNALLCLTSTALFPEFGARMLSSGAISTCINILRISDVTDEFERDHIWLALVTLCSFAMHHGESLRNMVGVVDATMIYISLLPNNNNNNNEDEQDGFQDVFVMIGFSAARLLLRLLNVSDLLPILEKNPAIVQFYPKLIHDVLLSGAKRGFFCYGSYWSLSGIARDVAIISSPGVISTSDDNIDTFILPLIPLVIQMLREYGDGDYELLRYGFLFLTHILSHEPCIKLVMRNHQLDIYHICIRMMSDCHVNVEHYSLMGDVRRKVG